MPLTKDIEISVIIPCLNEKQGIGICVKKSLEAFKTAGLEGEVVVVDNGSIDGSAEIAEFYGARVIRESKKGYGNAYLRGFSEAKGRYLVMGDADDTYDFLETPKFVDKLKAGFDYVSGNRLNSLMIPGAMPWSHRWIGNPILTLLLNLMFGAKVSDVYCGMRGMTRDAYTSLSIRSTGWEFALEMAIKASKYGLKITEVPIAYYPRKGESKLNTFSDGWRSLRFMLLFSPLYLFILPGLFSIGLGILLLVLYIAGYGRSLLGVYLDGYPPFMSSLLIILGYQIISFGFSSKMYSLSNNYDKGNSIIEWLFSKITLEDGILFGFVVLILGICVSVVTSFGSPSFSVINSNSVNSLISLTLIIIGVQTIFSSFFLSIFGLKKK